MVGWGDYGHVLQHGLGLMLPRQDGLMVVLRTGPFIPPFTFPGWPSFDPRGSRIVVVDAARTQLGASGLTGITYQAVLKGRIVWLPWHEWDLSAEGPHLRATGGEPVNYVLELEHSEEASEALGDLREIVADPIDWMAREVREDEEGERITSFRVLPDRWKSEDFFRIHPAATLLCSERAKEWLETNFPACLTFQPLPIS